MVERSPAIHQRTRADLLRRRRSEGLIFETWTGEITAAVRTLGGRDWRTATVTESPVQYGVSRQYQVFAEGFSVDAIFTDPDEAMTWLLSSAR